MRLLETSFMFLFLPTVLFAQGAETADAVLDALSIDRILDIMEVETLEAGEELAAAQRPTAAARAQARTDKDWGRADEIRDELDAKGIIVMDRAEGSTWRVRL